MTSNVNRQIGLYYSITPKTVNDVLNKLKIQWTFSFWLSKIKTKNRAGQNL